MADLYLGRLLTLDGADSFERALAGEKVQIGPDVIAEDIALSTVKVNPNFDKFESDIAKRRLMKNKLQTEKVHSYCMVSDTLEGVMENLKVCAYQATSEDAINNIDNGRASANDYFGRDRVSLFVIKMKEAEFRNFCNIGVIGYDPEGGKYELNGATQLLPEAIVGDGAIAKALEYERAKAFFSKEILDEKRNDYSELVLYDEVHKAFDAVNMDYDPEHLFSKSYKPSKVINHINVKLKQKPNNELQKAYEEIMAMDLSEEDRKLMLEALSDAMEYEP